MLKTNLKKFLFAFIAFIFVFSSTASVFATDTDDEDDDTNTIVISNTTETETTESEAETNSDSVYANTTLEVVDNTVCTIDVGGYGEFTKQITSFDAEEKSVTLTLTMTNTKDLEGGTSDVEIFFVIDNSTSMLDAYNGTTRKDAVIEAANTLVEEIFEADSNAKVGVVGFSSLNAANDEIEGTINDAELRLGLSTSESEVQAAISNLSEMDCGPRTNIDAGLTVAQNNFSDDEGVTRYIILLTDGLPNNTTTGIYGSYSGNTSTITKARIEEIENSGISIIGAMINLDGETVEPTTGKTYSEIAEEVFGTEEDSTLTKYFNISDDEIYDTIVNDIFDSLVFTKDNTLKNIVIKDYFPQEIIDNFDFEYVASPNIGSVSTEIDTDDNSITWYIELLSEGETATLSYKLILKEDYDSSIIDVVLATNENVTITGETSDGDIDTSSDDSPTVVVRYEAEEEEEEEEEENIVDNTLVTESKLPQTGELTLWFLVAAVIIAAIFGGRLLILNKNNKQK